MSFTGLLNAEMVVTYNSMSVTAYGGQTAVLSTISSAQPCRVQQLSMSERAILNREGFEATHRIFCNADVSMNTKYSVVVSSVTYEVTGWTVPDGALLGHHMEIDARRLG
jgi:hypothetical protein